METQNSTIETNESVKSEIANALNDASAKSLKQSTFKKKVLKAEAAKNNAPAKKESAEKKKTTKKLNEVVAVAIASENKYLYLFQKENKLSAVEQKKKRSAIRRKLFSFADAIYLANKAKNTDKLIEAIKEFKTFHKANYVNTKLEVKNLFTSDKDSAKVDGLKDMIKIISKSALKAEFSF